MLFQQAEEEFAVRFYRWSMLEAQSEVNHGFPLMRRIDNSYCRKHICHMAQLPREDQLACAALLVKRFHAPKVVEAAGDTLLSREEIESIIGYFDVFPLERDPVDEAFYDRLHRGDPTAKLDRRRFRKTVMQCLLPILGKGEDWGGGVYRYITPTENLSVITWIDTGGSAALQYYHDIQYSERQYLCERISPLYWLGLMGGSTAWSNLDDSKAEETAQLLAELCSYFLRAVPELLKGLGP